MSDKIQGGIKPGSTDVSIEIALFGVGTGAPLTGKVAADMTAYYYRQGAAAAVAIALSDLGSLNAVHLDGGVYEINSTHVEGHYRLDLPDAAVAVGADFVTISIYTADSNKMGVWTYELGATVVAGSVSDKTGYSLSSSGLDSVGAPADLANDVQVENDIGV